ncbi:toll/interleukin-1 receptor-like protein [Quercus lobata]|uniref:toll/interleukin-1 receptor-like protein n=1 Tax=Quercus lobata TaxID=97700 RepID=UPI0012462091|nr:toll/interleukin-1 receptor-like protein [Quercus lobata]
MSTPGATSSSVSSLTPRWKYDVFLSFRGEDTRNNFTDHLYAALQRKGIVTFRDEEGLEKGESISPALLKAIEESRFAIIILSKNYVSSSWCMEKLAKMVRCRKETGLTILPIFYHVSPSDVRKQAEALYIHNSSDTILKEGKLLRDMMQLFVRTKTFTR